MSYLPRQCFDCHHCQSFLVPVLQAQSPLALAQNLRGVSPIKCNQLFEAALTVVIHPIKAWPLFLRHIRVGVQRKSSLLPDNHSPSLEPEVQLGLFDLVVISKGCHLYVDWGEIHKHVLEIYGPDCRVACFKSYE